MSPSNVTIGVGSASETDDRVFFTVTGYLTPSTLWLADAATGKLEKLKSSPPKFDASTHLVEQLWATSKDGTRVPYFVVRPKDLKYDGSAPTLLYAYGGFQQSMKPGYSATVGKLWLENGGVYVVANIRGGGEFGPAWHEAGLKANRQRVYDDFFAVSEDLIARKITSPRRLGIMGGSNGGLLMGVALTQRPELYNAVVIQVPLFDMLGYTKLGAGASWVGEYGDPAIPEERAWIAAYDPYSNLKAGKPYPQVFIETSTKDDRVHPAHARKAGARLGALGYGYLYYENIDGGHSAAANLGETATRLALEYTYLMQRPPMTGPMQPRERSAYSAIVDQQVQRLVLRGGQARYRVQFLRLFDVGARILAGDPPVGEAEDRHGEGAGRAAAVLVGRAHAPVVAAQQVQQVRETVGIFPLALALAALQHEVRAVQRQQRDAHGDPQRAHVAALLADHRRQGEHDAQGGHGQGHGLDAQKDHRRFARIEPGLHQLRAHLVGDTLDAGADRDQSVLVAAFRAGARHRLDMPAMMAGEAVDEAVLDHPGGAVRTLEAVAAGAAQGQRGIAAA
eukprot:gene28512-37638_t